SAHRRARPYPSPRAGRAGQPPPVVRLLRVMPTAQTYEVIQRSFAAVSHWDDVVDLEVSPLVAARYHARDIARFQRRAQRGGDRSPGMRDLLHVDPVKLEKLHGAPGRKPPCRLHRDRTHSRYATRLAGFGVPARERALRHVHVDDGFG